MSNVRSLSTVAAINWPEMIASGLEEVAASIRRGELEVAPMRAVLVVCGRDGRDHDQVGMQFFGAEAGTAEIVGLLELAKHETIGAS